MARAGLFLHAVPRVTLPLVLLFALTLALVPVLAGPGRAVVPNPTVAASSTEAWAVNQTLHFSGTVTVAGRLASVTMGLPAGFRWVRLRSSSGTVAPHTQPNTLIWRPAAPIDVAVGARLTIPVSAIHFGAAGTYRMSFRAADTANRTLSSGLTAPLTLTYRTLACPASYPASYIAAENAKPGHADWRLSAYSESTLSAYLSHQSVACGEPVWLKVHAAASPVMRLSVYRMGYYGGAGARRIWSTEAMALAWAQPPRTVVVNDPQGRPINMVSAKAWTTTIGVRIDGRFPPGTYLFKVDDTRGRQAYMPLTVRDGTPSRHAYLLQQAVTTWQSYNQWGGISFYTKPTFSAQLTFDRPYDRRGQGSGQYLPLEYGLVYWMEKQGLDVAYWTDLDLHQRAAELPARTRTLVLPSHDEYYSAQMRQGLIDGIAAGVNVLSLGANQMYRKINPDPTGRDYLVDHRWTPPDGNTTWRSRGYAFHEQAILGAEFGCGSFGSPVTDTGWLWSGITPGTKLTGLAVGETDWVHPIAQAPIPAGLVTLDEVTLDRCEYYPAQPLRMDIVAHVAPSGARVLHAPTFGWSCFLIASCTWVSGGLPITPATAAAVGQAVRNMLSWTESGLVAAPTASAATALRTGRLRAYLPQRVGHLQPRSGLPYVTIPEPQD
jgi:hypothetical protein